MVLAGDVDVPAGSVVGEVVVIRGDVTVEGVVDGDVIVLRGAITVAGQVRGDVVSVSGRVRLRPTAQVGGSVLAGETAEVEAGAQVAGGVTQGVRYTLGSAAGTIGALLAPAAFSLSTLLLLALLLLLAPRGLERAGRAGRESPFASAGWGVLAAVAVALGGVLLTATGRRDAARRRAPPGVVAVRDGRDRGHDVDDRPPRRPRAPLAAPARCSRGGGSRRRSASCRS